MVAKFAAALLASGLMASVSAGSVHGHHQNLHKKAVAASSEASKVSKASSCGCYTYTTTWYGEATLAPAPVPSSSSSSSSTWSSSSSSSSSSTTSTHSSTSTTSTTSSSPSSTSTWTPPPTTSSTSSWVAPTTSSTWVAPTTSSTWVAPTTSSTWVAPTTSSTWEAPSSSWTPAPSSTASDNNKNGGWGNVINSVVSKATSAAGAVATKATGAAGAIAANGDKWAMTYTPYANDGSCKTAAEVSADISSIKNKGFTAVRLYATDCSGPQNVGNACKDNGLKIILGVYIEASGLSPAWSQVDTLAAWGKGQWDMVEMVVVGNEAIFNGWTDAGSLAGFINKARTTLQAAGYNGPVTTSDTVASIQANADTLCPALDVVAANIHPFFNMDIDAAGAGAFVSSQLSLLAGLCGSKAAYNLETGWPSAGDANGKAVPGFVEQKTAIASIAAAAGSKSAFFSFENDAWKSPGSLGVEQFWGCASLF